MEQKQENNYTPQQSKDWFAAKVGKASSSTIFQLMAGKTEITKDSPLQATHKTYIHNLFAELVDGFKPEVKAWTLEYGIANEPKAKQLLADNTGRIMIDSERIQHSTILWYGGSPDGYFGNEAVLDPLDRIPEITIEIKCPATATSHLENILFFKSNEALKKGYPELYWQVQSNMYLQNTQSAIIVSYHHEAKLVPAYIQAEISRNDADIELMLIQLDKGFKYYKEHAALYGITDLEQCFTLKDLERKHEAWMDLPRARVGGYDTSVIIATPTEFDNAVIVDKA